MECIERWHSYCAKADKPIVGLSALLNSIPKQKTMPQNTEIQDALFPTCPVRNILARVGDKWSLLVLHTLSDNGEAMRFNTIQKALPDISQKVLTATLRNLEEDGFVVRTIYAEVLPRVDYRLTERARSFIEVCEPVIQWAITHFDEILNDRKAHKRQTQ